MRGLRCGGPLDVILEVEVTGLESGSLRRAPEAVDFGVSIAALLCSREWFCEILGGFERRGGRIRTSLRKVRGHRGLASDEFEVFDLAKWWGRAVNCVEIGSASEFSCSGMTLRRLEKVPECNNLAAKRPRM